MHLKYAISWKDHLKTLRLPEKQINIPEYNIKTPIKGKHFCTNRQPHATFLWRSPVALWWIFYLTRLGIIVTSNCCMSQMWGLYFRMRLPYRRYVLCGNDLNIYCTSGLSVICKVLCNDKWKAIFMHIAPSKTLSGTLTVICLMSLPQRTYRIKA